MSKMSRNWLRVGISPLVLFSIALVMGCNRIAAAAAAASKGQAASVTWSVVTNNTGGSIDAVSGRYTAGSKPGVDTIRAVDANGVVGTTTIEQQQIQLTLAASSVPVCMPVQLKVSGGSHFPGWEARILSGAPDALLTANQLTGALSGRNLSLRTLGPIEVSAGSTPGNLVIEVSQPSAPAFTATVTLVVLPSYLELASSIAPGGAQFTATPVPPVHCGKANAATPSTPAPPSVTPLPNGTLRATVATGQVNRYSATVSAGTQVVSLTGIIGAAKLDVYSDAAFTQPVTCLAPANLANSTYAQPADCSFVAAAGTVYASVTGTSYLATASNRYDILVAQRNEAAATIQGTAQNPIVLPVNQPFAGTVGKDQGDSSYYVVNTTGSDDIVFSLTGQTMDEGLDLFIYDNPAFNGVKLDNVNCHTGEFLSAPETCILPPGKTYYLKVRNTLGTGIGGPFTLMAYSPSQVATKAVAVPVPPPGALQQAVPASSTAP